MERQKLHLTVGWIGIALMAAGAAWFAVIAGSIETTRTPRLYDLVDSYSLLIIFCLVWGFVAWRSFASSWNGIRRRSGASEFEGAADAPEGIADAGFGSQSRTPSTKAGQAPGRGRWIAAIALNGLYVIADSVFVVFLAHALWQATKGG